VTTRAARAAVACLVDNGATGTPCWVCGQALNYALPKRHRLAAVPYLLAGGDPAESGDLAPVHRECRDKASQRNSRRW
jgi:hypothetical protein